MTDPVMDRRTRVDEEPRGDWGNLKFELVDDVPDAGPGYSAEEAQEIMDRPVPPVGSSTQSEER